MTATANTTTNATRTRMKAFGRVAAVGLTAGLGVAGLGVTPASADAPAEFSLNVTFPDVNPCTGTANAVTLNLDVREHVHGDRVVVHVSRTGTTTDGYVMKNGQESFVFNGNVARRAFHDTWRNADGSMFEARGFFVEKEDGPVADGFRLRCIKP